MVSSFVVPAPENRRSYGRGSLAGTAGYASPHRVLIARAGDVSPTGAFLSTLFPDPVGTRALLHLELDGQRVQVDVEVVRVSFMSGPDGRGAGMGLVFTSAPRPEKARKRREATTR